ncbi:hydroxysqualene dehydroxylase HpnE [Burkholderiaceae bacterium DAT-1]|nr:hydroxysqualene dehydroxylase HpnE [Burkholderiaceae bacterium DAT-1]
MNHAVAVIGAGFAGCAAAVTLAEAGHHVSVFEAGPLPGGRARRVELSIAGRMHALDNGQHLLIGAYQSTLSMMRLVGVDPERVLKRQALDLDMGDTFRLCCPALPSPLHALFGLLGAKGVSLADRLGALRAMTHARLTGYRLSSDTTVQHWLQMAGQSEQMIRCLWEPLTLAALNTPIQKASAQVLLNVLRDSLGGSRQDSDFLIPVTDLSELFPLPAMRYVQQHGGQFLPGKMVRKLARNNSKWCVDDRIEHFDHVIIALPPHRVDMLETDWPGWSSVCQTLKELAYQPITTLYLQFPATFRLGKAMMGLVGTTAQWIFDHGDISQRPGLLAVVISAEGSHQAWTQAQLTDHVLGELRTRLPDLPEPEWTKVITEKRATFACVPGIQRLPNQLDTSLYLAGDHTQGDYPATIEGAVRSGQAAAYSLIANLRRQDIRS